MLKPFSFKNKRCRPQGENLKFKDKVRQRTQKCKNPTQEENERACVPVEYASPVLLAAHILEYKK